MPYQPKPKKILESVYRTLLEKLWTQLRRTFVGAGCCYKSFSSQRLIESPIQEGFRLGIATVRSSVLPFEGGFHTPYHIILCTDYRKLQYQSSITKSLAAPCQNLVVVSIMFYVAGKIYSPQDQSKIYTLQQFEVLLYFLNVVSACLGYRFI